MSIGLPRVAAAMRRLSLIAAASLALGLAGCASDDAGLTEGERGVPVEVLYNDAMDSLASENWRDAATKFELVEQQYPYSVWARRAILMAAYSHYQVNKYQDAINATDRFLALHAGNRDAPYAYYLKAISLYEQIVDVGRDQANTQAALVALNDVVQRYPNTEYARDARLKIDLTLDHLAGKEMTIGRYYLVRYQYVAAINRFRSVVENFQTTSHVPEALHRLTEAYVALGLRSEAQAAAAVLGYNYPGSDWYLRSYALLTGENLAPADDGSTWLGRLFSGVF